MSDLLVTVSEKLEELQQGFEKIDKMEDQIEDLKEDVNSINKILNDEEISADLLELSRIYSKLNETFEDIHWLYQSNEENKARLEYVVGYLDNQKSNYKKIILYDLIIIFLFILIILFK